MLIFVKLFVLYHFLCSKNTFYALHLPVICFKLNLLMIFISHTVYDIIYSQICWLPDQYFDIKKTLRVVLGWAYRGLTGGFLLLQNFCVAISVSPHVCFILVLILISMFLR